MSDDKADGDSSDDEYTDAISQAEDKSGVKFLCKHYDRRCFMECPQCLQFYPCRLCHNECADHELDRYNVKNIKCSACNSVQTVTERCTKCQTHFAKYFCSICNMFDDRDRQQFHCDGCGLCRVGGRKNFFHCPTCDLCLSVDIRTTHKCVEKSSKANCPVCLGDLHTSVMNLQVPSCGHLIHRGCYTEMLKHGEYRCPTCGKSTVQMSNHWKLLDREIEATPMPPEYSNTMTWILCKDCQAVSKVKFHVLGMKCGACGSYNTCGTSDPNERGHEQGKDGSDTPHFNMEELD